MAVYLPVQPQPQGYADLGQALMTGVQGYEQNALRDKLRGQQLADIAAQRDYQTVRDTSEHQFEMDRAHQDILDREAMDEKEMNAKAIQALVNEGFLKDSDKNNPEAIQGAIQLAAHSGKLQQYKEAISQGFLDPSDVDDQDKVDQALSDYGDFNKKIVQAQVDEKTDAKADATNLVGEIQKHQANISAISGQLNQLANSSPRQFTATDPEVQAQAAQIAEQAKPGSSHNIAAVQAQIPTAIQQLNTQAQAMYQETTGKKISALNDALNAERYQAQQATTRLDHLQQTLKVSPGQFTGDVTADPSYVAPVAQSPALKPAPASVLNAAKGSVLGGAPGAGAPAPSSLPNPVNDPIIDAENQRQALAAVQTPLQQTQQELDDVNQQIQQIRQAGPQQMSTGSPMVPGLGPIGYSADQAQTNQAQQLSDLYTRQRALSQQQQALQSRLAALNAPNTAASAGNGIASTGAVLNDPTTSDATSAAPPTAAVGAFPGLGGGVSSGGNWWGGSSDSNASGT